MNKWNLIVVLVLYCSFASGQQNWTHYVRTSGHGLNQENINDIIKDATDTYLFGIEVDNDPTGRYASFLNPSEKLEILKLMTEKAHEFNNYAFIYIAGLECITANADKTEHTFYKDHPDWVQRDINNRPAIFRYGDAFWIDVGDEDAWISPYATEWRNIYMNLVRNIVKTGVDGIYVDIPYWMTHFEGWTNTWASFDEYTLRAFKEKTGLDAQKDLKLGDFSDSNFRKWVDFRIESITKFLEEINQVIKKENPNCMLIAEIYPGLGEEAVRVGADVYEIYKTVDVVAHEFDGSGGNAASKNSLDWFDRMIGMYTFRAFAENKASWMLSYSWNEQNKIDPQEPMKNLMLSNLIAGTNCWDARGYVMSGSNDIETRKAIFKWISEHEEIFYKPRKLMNPIGIYFSPQTRNYFADEFIKSYNGIMNLVLQSHLEFQIVTPRTLNNFKGKILILPNVKCISNEEINYLESFVNNGGSLIVTGESGNYNIDGSKVERNPIFKLLGIKDTNQKKLSMDKLRYIYYPQCPGKLYMDLCDYEFNVASWKGNDDGTSIKVFRENFWKEVYNQFGYQPNVIIKASPFLSTQITMVENKLHVFIANYKGLKGNEIGIQSPEKNVRIEFTGIKNGKIFYLPFLGKKIELKSQSTNGRISCVVPEIEKGGVVWNE